MPSLDQLPGNAGVITRDHGSRAKFAKAEFSPLEQGEEQPPKPAADRMPECQRSCIKQHYPSVPVSAEASSNYNSGINMFKKFLLVLCLLPNLALAADDQPSDEKVWSGEGAFGFTSSSGNTETENLNAALKFARQTMQWKHSLALEAIRNETDNVTSADRWSIKGRSEYALSEKSYSFGQARYEEDEFSGYSEQASLVVGLGSRFIENDKHLLDLSAGVGYRNLKVSDTDVTEDGGILTSDLIYEYKISESTTFIEIALIEAGDNNTFFQSETALRSQISGSLSSQISYLVKHNSDVPVGTEKTDKIISISLVYGF